MLAEGPARVADLLKAPGAVSNRENPAELAGLLTGTRQALLLTRPGAAPSARLRRFNAVLAERLSTTENLKRTVAVASEAVGGGVTCSLPELFLAGRAIAGEEAGDEAAWAEQLGPGLNEEMRGRVADALRRSRATMPLLRALGCLD
jgi:hypothetical protein